MEPIGQGVDRELARLGPVAGIGRLVAAWSGAVGETVARNAWPARIARDRTLHVATSSSAWAFELAQLAPMVLERLREALGEEAPTGLRFAPGKLPEPGPEPAEAARNGPQPGPQERMAGDELAAGIADDDLRSLVARAAAASLARAAARRSV